MMASSLIPPHLIAHRGNAAEFPENTLPAFESALELGVRNIEFDVQLTSDKVPVVIHDADLQTRGRPVGKRARHHLGGACEDFGR